MDQLDREVIESLSESAKRVFGSLDYRSRQRMLKKAGAMAKEEKTRNKIVRIPVKVYHYQDTTRQGRITVKRLPLPTSDLSSIFPPSFSIIT